MPKASVLAAAVASVSRARYSPISWRGIVRKTAPASASMAMAIIHLMRKQWRTPSSSPAPAYCVAKMPAPASPPKMQRLKMKSSWLTIATADI